jgi:PAS domain S-box-containing protein
MDAARKTKAKTGPESGKEPRPGTEVARDFPETSQGTGKEGIRILILEDTPADADLTERTLRKAGIQFVAERVDMRDDFIRALREFKPEIVLSDYSLPGFDGLSAIKIVREKSADLPVILVTGALGDEAAVEVVKAGANDYILKDRLARLPLAVQRALSAAAEVRNKMRAQAAIEASELRYRGLFEAAKDGILILDAENGRILDVNPSMITLLGYSYDEYCGKSVWDMSAFKDVDLNKGAFAKLKSKGYLRYEDLPLQSRDGQRIDVEFVGNTYNAGEQNVIQCNIRDITERKRAESVLKRVNRALKTITSANEALVRAGGEQALLDAMCRVLVEVGGFRLVCIGLAERDAAKTVRIVAAAGPGVGYLERARSSWEDSARGWGPSGTAIRTGEPQISQNFATDRDMEPWRAEALRYGLASSVAFPLSGEAGVFGALTIYAAEPEAFNVEEIHLLNGLSNDLAYGIGALRARGEREVAIRQLRQSLEDAVGAIASTIEVRDPYTSGHQQRVAKLSVAIAREIGLGEEQIHGIYLAGVIHDVGKMNIPAEILSKPGNLSKTEHELIQTHPQAGFNIVKGIDFPWPIAQAVLQHHERLNGSGYPNGIKGEAMLIEAKVLAVADVVEAMMAHRPYRAARGLEAALAEVENGKGHLYDAATVDACVALFRQKGFNFQ